jgi:hypothetical protein
MTELLFIAITIFAAYAIFTAINGGQTQETHAEPAEKPEKTAPAVAEPAPTEPENPLPHIAAAASEPSLSAPSPAPKAAKPKAAKPASTRKTAAKTEKQAEPAPAPSATASDSDSIKNPKTGEVAKITGNYAFAKRWIKDALVTEGLLDKVYKNTELDNATQAKIQVAIQQLKALPKYQA